MNDSSMTKNKKLVQWVDDMAKMCTPLSLIHISEPTRPY